MTGTPPNFWSSNYQAGPQNRPSARSPSLYAGSSPANGSPISCSPVTKEKQPTSSPKSCTASPRGTGHTRPTRGDLNRRGPPSIHSAHRGRAARTTDALYKIRQRRDRRPWYRQTDHRAAHYAACAGAAGPEVCRSPEGWHDVAVGHRFDPDSDVEQLLADLCIGLGFCLPPAEIRHLCEAPPKTVDSFTDGLRSRRHGRHELHRSSPSSTGSCRAAYERLGWRRGRRTVGPLASTVMPIRTTGLPREPATKHRGRSAERTQRGRSGHLPGSRNLRRTRSAGAYSSSLRGRTRSHRSKRRESASRLSRWNSATRASTCKCFVLIPSMLNGDTSQPSSSIA